MDKIKSLFFLKKEYLKMQEYLSTLISKEEDEIDPYYEVIDRAKKLRLYLHEHSTEKEDESEIIETDFDLESAIILISLMYRDAIYTYDLEAVNEEKQNELQCRVYELESENSKLDAECDRWSEDYNNLKSINDNTVKTLEICSKVNELLQEHLKK